MPLFSTTPFEQKGKKILSRFLAFFSFSFHSGQNPTSGLWKGIKKWWAGPRLEPALCGVNEKMLEGFFYTALFRFLYISRKWGCLHFKNVKQTKKMNKGFWNFIAWCFLPFFKKRKLMLQGLWPISLLYIFLSYLFPEGILFSAYSSLYEAFQSPI